MTHSWRVTAFAQAVICLAALMTMIFFVFLTPRRTSGNLDMYFISVGDVEIPLAQRRALANQIKATALDYAVQFVVSICDGDTEDGLLGSVHEAFHTYPALHVPWYSVVGDHLQKDEARYFRKEIQIPHQQTMHIIGIDTNALQDPIKFGSLKNDSQDQLDWLKQTLAGNTADWFMVIGRHPLNECLGERVVKDTEQLHNLLLPMFVKYGVHVYLHGQEQFSLGMQNKDIACIGNPVHGSATNSHIRNETYSLAKDIHNGFILYRVCPLEMELYFIDWKGTMLHRATVHKNGRAVM